MRRATAERTVSFRTTRAELFLTRFDADPARHPGLSRPLAVAGLHANGLPALRGAFESAGGRAETVRREGRGPEYRHFTAGDDGNGRQVPGHQQGDDSYRFRSQPDGDGVFQGDADDSRLRHSTLVRDRSEGPDCARLERYGSDQGNPGRGGLGERAASSYDSGQIVGQTSGFCRLSPTKEADH